MTDKPKNLALTIEFNVSLGFFHSCWATTEGSIDFAIGKFLPLNPEQTHLVTAGMDHGRKLMLLRDLISRSDHENRAELLRILKVIQNESLRNVFAHSYIASDENTVWFIERTRGGPYKVKHHEFTKKEFVAHVKKFTQASADFETALGFTDDEIVDFLNATYSLIDKS